LNPGREGESLSALSLFVVDAFLGGHYNRREDCHAEEENDPLMTAGSSDPMTLKRQADVIIETTARQLRDLVHEAVAQLDPFPPFPGSFFTYGIEVEGGAAESRERGCVVLASDGDLYALEISIDPSRQLIDPVGGRDEKLKKLDLHPRDYIFYAYDALTKVTELLLEQEAARRA
jgi:hypothetical protein